MVSLMVILFSKKCFLFFNMYIDLLKLKANKLFKIVMLTSPGFFFKEGNFLKILGIGSKRPNSEKARSKTAHFTKTAHEYGYQNGPLFRYGSNHRLTNILISL